MSDVINAHDLGVAGGYIIEAAMQGDIDQLKAENAKLQEDVDRLIKAIEDLHDVSLEDKLVQLENSNDKLRELVKKLVILAFARCADCDLLDASCALVSTQKCLLWNECESIARELGVEVDE